MPCAIAALDVDRLLIICLTLTVMVLALLLATTRRRLRCAEQLAADRALMPRRCSVATQCPSDDDSMDAALTKLHTMLMCEQQQDDSLARCLDDDNELRRCLEATRLDVKAAHQRILATDRWRAKRAAAHMRESSLAGRSGATSLQRVAVVGTDLQGRPCLRVRLREPLESFPEELLGVLEAHFAGTSCRTSQLTILLDLRLFTLAALQRPPLAAGFALVRTLRAHYPQRCAAVHILHLPPIGRWLVGAVCSLLDSRTARKVAVHEAEGVALAAALADHFAPSQLPAEYGGTDPGPLLPKERLVEADSGGVGTNHRNGHCCGDDGQHSGSYASRLAAAPGCANPMPRFLDGSIGNGVPKSASGASELSAMSDYGDSDESRHATAFAASRPVSPRPARPTPRYVWSVLTEAEVASVHRLRAACAADAEMSSFRPGFDPATMPDDELVRFLVDCTPPHNQVEALQAMRAAARARRTNITMALPMPPAQLEAWSHVVRFDGVTRDGEPTFLVIFSRALQDALLEDPEPFLHLLIGLMDATRRYHFRMGEMETVQTVVQIERGFRLSLKAIADFTRATQRVMGALTDMFPSYTSRILVVNLPPSLAWFVKFIKGFLCEASAMKIELINDFDQLHEFYDDEHLPSYYRERGSITP